jgi:hypothetical protein
LEHETRGSAKDVEICRVLDYDANYTWYAGNGVVHIRLAKGANKQAPRNCEGNVLDRSALQTLSQFAIQC